MRRRLVLPCAGRCTAVVLADGVEIGGEHRRPTIIELPDNTLDRRLAQAPLQFRKRAVTLTLEQIAKLSGGELEGDRETKITGAASLAEATVHEISFFNNPRYLAQLRKTRAAAVIVPRDFAEQIGVAIIRTPDPAKAFEQVVTKFAPPPIKFAPGIHPSAVIHPRAKLGDHISIQPLVVIEAGARIGSRAGSGAATNTGHDVMIG